MDKNISVIVPTYNEKEGVGLIMQRILREIQDVYEIIVVDDDSPDLTWKIVEDMSAADNRIRLIRRIGKKGLSQAIWEGIMHAKGKIVMWFDADFSAPAGTLAGLAQTAQQYDIAVLSRYCEGGRDNRKEKGRVAASRIFNGFAQWLLATIVKDLTSGYIAARKEVFDSLKFSGAYGEYCIRFLYQAQKAGFHIQEVPYECLSRVKGKSKTSGNILAFTAHGLRYLWFLLKVRIVDG